MSIMKWNVPKSFFRMDVEIDESLMMMEPFDCNLWGVNLEFSIIKMVKSLMEFLIKLIPLSHNFKGWHFMNSKTSSK